VQENLYKNILYNSPIGYAFHEMIFDQSGEPLDYRFIEVNPAFETFTGLLAKDIIGKTILEVIPGIEKETFKWIEVYGDIVKNNETRRFDAYSEHLKSWYCVEVFSPEKNHFITVFNDITLSKKQDDNILALQSVFSNIVKHAPVPIMIHTDVGKVLNISDAWEDISGYSKNDIPTINAWTKAAYGSKQNDVKAFVNELYNLKERQHDGVFVIKSKDNQELSWDFYSAYIGNTSENNKMAMSVAIDITEDLKNKKALAKERLLFETTLLSVGDGVICTDKSGKITLINKIAEELTGWTKEEAIGMKIEEVFSIYSELTGEKSENIINKVINSGIIHELANHTILKSKDGIIRPIADSAAPIILSNGEVIGAVLVFRDYTDKYNAQKERESLVNELQQTQTLLKASLNSPVNMIVLAIDNDYNYLYFNNFHKEVMKSAYGMDVEIGMNLMDCITSEVDKANSKMNYDLALSGKSNTTIEEYGDINKAYYESFYNPIYDGEKIIGCTAYARDITERINNQKALISEKERAQNYLNIAGVIILFLNKEGVVSLINRTGCKILGYDEKDIVGKNWFDNFIPKHDYESIKEVFNHVFVKGNGIIDKHENSIINAKGEERYISWYNSILYDQDGELIGVLSSGEDITESKLAEDKLRISENRYKEVLNSLEAGIVIHANDTRIISFNKRAEVILGLEYDELRGETANSKKFQFVDTNYQKLKHEKYPVNIIISTKKPVKNYIIGIKHIHEDKLFWVSVNGVPIYNEDNSINEVVVSFIDITDEKVQQDEIKYLSSHDYLTELYNRRFFAKKYGELDNKKYYPLGIMMIDVNGLKIINDAFGHEVGDIALRKAAKLLLEAFGDADVVCRIGGDEFAIIIPNISEEKLEIITETIKTKSQKSNVENISLSLAIGYAIKDEKSKESLDEVLKLAENQMYRHKLSESISVRNNAIKAILKTLTNKYSEERIHSAKVSLLCKHMGVALALKEEEIKELELAGMYHDIGKISIPDAILKKPQKLTTEEFNIIKTHPEISYQILKAADEYSDLAVHALYHHERWDGNGYPAQKKGKDIPLFSRIICIVDAFEAMTSDRVYKEKFTEEQAIMEIIRCSGTQFDPELARVFVEKVLKADWN
jgi:diguanylate cyclase (GGDEF)-like protein/PAS domain S-box-containing protein